MASAQENSNYTLVNLYTPQGLNQVADKHTFHLLLSSDTISVKYKIDVVYSSKIKRFSGADRRTQELHVTDLHSVPLLEDDLVQLA